MPHVPRFRLVFVTVMWALLAASCASSVSVPVGQQEPEVSTSPAPTVGAGDQPGGQPDEVPGEVPGDQDRPVVIDARVDVELDYRDVTGNLRRVRAQLRLPEDPGEAPLPVFSWSHGGSTGKRNPDTVGRAWGRAANRAGFAFVAVAHSPRSADDHRAVCEAIGADPCDSFNPLSWDRPHDMAVVFDWIGRWSDELGLDASALVHGGHSAGAIGVLSMAGAWPYASALQPEIDPRPIAFVAASPPGAEARGYDAAHLDALRRPTLMLSGLGDSTASTDGVDRRALFELLPESGPHHLVWIGDERARHGVFNLEPESCERAGGSTELCREMVRSLAQAVRGWLNTIESTHREGTPIDVAAMAEQAGRNLPPSFDWLSSTD